MLLTFDIPIAVNVSLWMSVVLHHVSWWVGTNNAEETAGSSIRGIEEAGSSEMWLPVCQLRGVVLLSVPLLN